MTVSSLPIALFSNTRIASGLIGTPEQVAAFEAAGADLLLLQCSPQMKEMEQFAASVIRCQPVPALD